MTKSSWRKLLVAPAVLSLALGGALLTATSASAAPGNLVVTSPTSGQTTATRDVEFSGTAVAGSKIVIHQDNQAGAVLETVASVPASGAWSVDHVYAADAAVAQTAFVDGVVGGSGFSDAKSVSFALPAPAAQLTVTSPTAGQYVTSRTVTVTGTGIPTANIALVPSAGTPTTGILVGADGSWTGQVTFPADVDRAQSITVNQIQGGAGRGSQTVNVNLPATQTLVVTTPKDGDTAATRTVTFSGTGTAGSRVSLDGDFPLVQATVRDDGAWSVDVTFAEDAATAQSVRLTQVTGGVGTGDVTVRFSLPAATTPPTTPPTTPIALDTPVITSPENGAEVVGSQVTFEGTGTPGSNILLLAVPTDQVTPTARAAAQPADPTDPIVVGTDGTWAVTLAAAPGDYTAAATSFLLGADGQPVLDTNGDPVVSAPSEPVEFTVTATPAAGTTPVGSGTTPVATGTGTVTPTGELAFTGADITPAAVIAGLLMLAGAALTVVMARRRSRIA